MYHFKKAEGCPKAYLVVYIICMFLDEGPFAKQLNHIVEKELFVVKLYSLLKPLCMRSAKSQLDKAVHKQPSKHIKAAP